MLKNALERVCMDSLDARATQAQRPSTRPHFVREMQRTLTSIC